MTTRGQTSNHWLRTAQVPSRSAPRSDISYLIGKALYIACRALGRGPAADREGHRDKGENAPLWALHNRPLSGALYEPVGQRLLPLDAQWQQGLANIHWPTSSPEVMGGGIATTRALIREYLFIKLFRASFEKARLRATTGAAVRHTGAVSRESPVLLCSRKHRAVLAALPKLSTLRGIRRPQSARNTPKLAIHCRQSSVQDLITR